MKDFYEMALEDLREDLEGNEVLADEEGNEIPEPQEIDPSEINEKLERLIAVEQLLLSEGLVSRKLASEFQEFLPRGIAVESFTELPTRVNYGVATESVSGAIRLVAFAGMAVLIGGLGVMIYRILKRRKKLPNNEMARKATAAFASIENKLKTALDEIRASFPDLKHPQMNWSRSDAAIRIASGHSFREIEARILAGKYPFMDNKLLQAAIDQGKRILDFIKSSVMPQIEKLSMMGTDADIDALSKTIEGFDVGTRADEELKRYVEGLGVNVPEGKAPIEAFRETLLAQIPADQLKSKVGEVAPEHREVDVRGAKGLIDIQEGFASVYSKLEALTKKIENDKKSELPAAYASKFKELIEMAKTPLKSLDSVMEIRDQETMAFNKVVAVKVETTKDGFVYIKTQYEQLAVGDKANEKDYGRAIRELGKQFADFKQAIK